MKTLLILLCIFFVDGSKEFVKVYKGKLKDENVCNIEKACKNELEYEYNMIHMHKWCDIYQKDTYNDKCCFNRKQIYNRKCKKVDECQYICCNNNEIFCDNDTFCCHKNIGNLLKSFSIICIVLLLTFISLYGYYYNKTKQFRKIMQNRIMEYYIDSSNENHRRTHERLETDPLITNRQNKVVYVG